MKIRVDFIYPPIPFRQFDYCAYDEDTYDGSVDSGNRGEVGWGRTEQEAIADLMQILEERG